MEIKRRRSGIKKSLDYNINALEIVEKIQTKFKEYTNISNLSKEDSAYLIVQILMLDENIQKTNYDGFSFKKDLHSIRNNFAHYCRMEEKQKLEERFKNFFGMIPKIKSKLIKSINRLCNLDKKNGSNEKNLLIHEEIEEEIKSFYEIIPRIKFELIQNINRPYYLDKKFKSDEKIGSNEKNLPVSVGRKEGFKKSIISNIVNWLLKTIRKLFNMLTCKCWKKK